MFGELMGFCVEFKKQILTLGFCWCCRGNIQMEAEAMVELLAEEYPDIKYWISFQCKVIYSSLGP